MRYAALIAIAACGGIGYVIEPYVTPHGKLLWVLLGLSFGGIVLMLFEVLAPGSLWRQLGRREKERIDG